MKRACLVSDVNQKRKLLHCNREFTIRSNNRWGTENSQLLTSFELIMLPDTVLKFQILYYLFFKHLYEVSLHYPFYRSGNGVYWGGLVTVQRYPASVQSWQIQIPVCYWERQLLKKSGMSRVCKLELGGTIYTFAPFQLLMKIKQMAKIWLLSCKYVCCIFKPAIALFRR